MGCKELPNPFGVSFLQVPDLDYFKTQRPIRVLSLFDGIGTGKRTKQCPVTLRQLVHFTDSGHNMNIFGGLGNLNNTIARCILLLQWFQW